ncbi:DUF6265 family protein [Brevundimonas sp. DC300-4]|uniref:DUF6265 family protein n=1 Tax=Brevundimonas sp. DC300-4 TaxID=2804594 RepID=UPI003CF39925
MILTALFVAGLTQAAPITADQLSWMSGYWLSCDGGREVSETWTDPRGGLMAGHAVTLQNGRASFELSRIAPTTAGAPGVAYFAGVEGARAVVFPVVEAGGTRVVFENAAHDFPQRVIYERDGDVLKARIEGVMGDRQQAMAWEYRKADLNARCPG